MAEDAVEVTPLATASGAEALSVLAHASMRCAGCGSKEGGSVLSRVLKRLELPPAHDDVIVGLDSPDDAAVVRGSPLASVHTVDFFRAFIDDPFVFGKVRRGERGGTLCVCV